MKLADDIIIRVGDEAITLRPSLRFAMRLERCPGSFAGLIQGIMDGSLTIAVQIIADHADMPFLESRVFDVLPSLREPLLAYIMACAGIEADEPANDNRAKGKPIPFSEHLIGLYRIGTGWLGWTPQDTLDATPAEIMEAHRGRLDMLKGIFGGGEDQSKPSDMSLDDKVKTAFGSFSTTVVKRRKAG